MAPEYGATMGFFPVDAETLAYLRLTGRDGGTGRAGEAYTKEQGLFRTDATPDPEFTDDARARSRADRAQLAGPKRPQDRVPLSQTKASLDRQRSTAPLKDGATPWCDEVKKVTAIRARS